MLLNEIAVPTIQVKEITLTINVQNPARLYTYPDKSRILSGPSIHDLKALFPYHSMNDIVKYLQTMCDEHFTIQRVNNNLHPNVRHFLEHDENFRDFHRNVLQVADQGKTFWYGHQYVHDISAIVYTLL